LRLQRHSEPLQTTLILLNRWPHYWYICSVLTEI
jgi:hypothetical protein